MTTVGIPNILVADDNPVLREVLEAMLRQWGYRVASASDGQETWEILQRADSPRVAILDWEMPGLDGLEICRLLRRTGRAVYVIMLVGHRHAADLAEALDSGVDDYASKPLRSAELRARLRAAQCSLELEEHLRLCGAVCPPLSISVSQDSQS
jgi:DNA-binding response OmpR family regulator